MSWKKPTHYSLVVQPRSFSELDAVHNIIDWEEVEQTLSSLYASSRGSLAYPLLLMFKLLILQTWYDLSDEGVEKQVAQGLMFRRFIDLSLSGSVPDHTRVWRFQEWLNRERLLAPLLDQINAPLERHQIIVSLGSVRIIDATVIEAKESRKRRGRAGQNRQDREAAYNVKVTADGKRTTTYGFKWHANTDEDGFIRKMTYTAGNVHDSQEFDKLLGKRGGAVYADKAYANKHNDDRLGQTNNQVLHRASVNKLLTDQQKAENTYWSKLRSMVERVFGLLKHHHGLRKARYLGLSRNKSRAQLIAISHNIKTGLNIFKAMLGCEDYCV